jgi:hypothetical protein
VRHTTIFCMALAASVIAFAGQPIATVSGSSSFELDGSLVNTAGVNAWPLMPGDRVGARDSSIVIAMKDGSRITLAANSQLRLESVASQPTADLISGSMQFSLAAGSNLRVLRGGTPVDGRSGQVSPLASPALMKAPPPTPVSAR